MTATAQPGRSQPVLAGLVAATVGFASSFTVVLAGLRAVGATTAQAASGLLVLCVTMGAVAIVLGLRHRMPLSIAWSTPGAALLVSTGVPAGGYPAALGAFAVTGVLIVLAGLWRPLARAIAAIPVALASAMLAGVLLPLCLAPVRAAIELPDLAAPVIVTWALLTRFARRWAVPAALVVALGGIALTRTVALGSARDLLPSVAFTVPSLHLGALAGLALPLFVVTMASQNVTGMGVLASFGYRPDLRPILVSTGAASALGAPFGAHGINLAAITAALAAGPDAHPDPARRWIASVAAGAAYLVIGLGAALATAFIAASPPLLVEAVAGLALLGALGGALRAATEGEADREAALITFVVTASQITALGVSAAFWGLLAGLGFRALMRARGA